LTKEEFDKREASGAHPVKPPLPLHLW